MGPRWPLMALMAAVALVMLGGVPGTGGGLSRFIALPASACIAAVAWWVLDLCAERLRVHRVILVLVAAGVVAIAAIAAIGISATAGRIPHLSAAATDQASLLAGQAALIGLVCRALFGRGSRIRQGIVAWAVMTWGFYLDRVVPIHPFRDAQLYLGAAHRFLDGQPVYITTVPAHVPADPAMYPFVYPPFTLPFFALFAVMPSPLGVTVFIALCAAAVVAGLRLFGVRWRFVPILMLWPPLAVGLQVGNVACFSFLVLAAAWWLPGVIPLGGVFKLQSGVMALWLVRERRVRALVVGLGALALGIVATLPLTGLAIYGDWLRSLGLFQSWLTLHPGLMGVSFQRWFGPVLAVGIAGVAVVIALLAGRRDGLSRMAIAATVASPTVYVHGFSLGLPAILFLDAASAWALLAVPTGRTLWAVLGLALAGLVLGLTRARLAATVAAEDGASSPTLGDDHLHPLGALPEPWPDRPPNQAAPVVG